MTFPSALSSPNYTSLRASGYKASQYLLLGSNTTVFAARVNQATFAASFAQITFDTVTTGAYTDIGEGMTVLISTTNDKRAAYFVGRVRYDQSGGVASATTLYINETSATITDNDYIFVIRDYRLFHELGRFANNVYYKDYNRTFVQLRPLIYGLQSAYAGIVSGTPAGFTVAFTASAVAATSGATISSYAWTIPSGGTVTAGSISAASVTVRFDASATEYWVKLIVTDSGSRTQTRYIPVWAIPANLSTTVSLGFTGADITGDIENGYSANVDAFTGVSTVLDNTLACVLDVEYYGSTETSIVSAVKFVGRLRTEANSTTADDFLTTSRKVTYEIEGPAAQMARLTTPIITMRDAASPTVWDEIYKLTVWRSVAYLLEHSTFHNLYSLSFDSTGDTYRAFQLSAPQGNLYQAAQDLLSSINAAMEFAATGEARAVRDLNFMTTGERAALTTVANFTSEDWISFSLDRDHVETVGIIEASGGSYVPSGGILAAMVRPMLSIAPGVAQGSSEGVGQLSGQILSADVDASVAQAELNTRTGNKYALENGNDVLNVDLRGGYNWIMPSRSTFYTWTIDATDDTSGRAYTTSNRWWCKSVSARHDNETGSKDVRAVFQLETSGADAGAGGQTVTLPPEGTAPDLPFIPPIGAYPYFPPPPSVYLPTNPTPGQLPPLLDTGVGTIGKIPVDGNAVITWSTEHVWMTKTFLGVPIWYDITPDNLLGTVRDVALDGLRIYVLSSDGTDSAIYTAANAFTTPLSYSSFGTIVDSYSVLRPASTQGSLYAYALTSTAWSEEYDFTTSASGWSLRVSCGADEGDWTLGTGYISVIDAPFNDGSDCNNWSTRLVLDRTFSSKTVTLIEVTYDYTPGSVFDSDDRQIELYAGTSLGTLSLLDSGSVVSTVDGVLSWTGSASYGAIEVNIWASGSKLTSTGTDGSATIKRIRIEGTNAAAGAQTIFSDDFAATFEAAEAVGTAVTGFAGMDTIKIGVQIIAGASGQTKLATAAGGAYSSYGSALPASAKPSCLIIPRCQFGGTTANTSTSTPQYLVASDTAATSETMWKVLSSGTTFTAITPTVSGNDGLAISQRSVAMTWWDGNYIAAVLDFGGTPRLVVSTNAGGAWTDRGVLDDDATMVTYRKGDKTKKQLFLTNGGPAYSPNHGSTIITKSYPGDSATEPVIGITVYG